MKSSTSQSSGKAPRAPPLGKYKNESEININDEEEEEEEGQEDEFDKQESRAENDEADEVDQATLCMNEYAMPTMAYSIGADKDGDKAGEGGRSGGNTQEVQLDHNYLWSDKYRPRKPRYYNRVHTGYDWNQYNKKHYDVDNPPPKTVQGYKFNVSVD